MSKSFAMRVVGWLCLIAISGGCGGDLSPDLNRQADNNPAVNLSRNCMHGTPTLFRGQANVKTQVIYRPGYVLEYSEQFKCPLWVAQRIEKSQLGGTALIRFMNEFKPDPRLTIGQATQADFEGEDGKDYQRGHLAASADFTADKELNADSFFMSNIAPQRKNFNTGVWVNLEGAVRDFLSSGHREVWVISGISETPSASILPVKVTRKTIGPNKVLVPKGFYKVVVWTGTDARAHCAAILLPHNEGTAAEPQPTSVTPYVIRLSELEAAVGIDFFPDLSPEEKQSMNNETSNEFIAFLRRKGL